MYVTNVLTIVVIVFEGYNFSGSNKYYNKTLPISHSLAITFCAEFTR